MKRILRTLMLLLASLIALSPAAAQEDAGGRLLRRAAWQRDAGRGTSPHPSSP